VGILVESSVWIDFFRTGVKSQALDALIEQNVIVVNDLILTEILPFLMARRQSKLVRLMQEISRVPLSIHWEELTKFQLQCLQNGINKIGIPDLIIIRNLLQNQLQIYSLDRHFSLKQQHFGFTVFK
jgi:predicted nucleic acid-binding protein